jgi:uncharacterized membrane protein
MRRLLYMAALVLATVLVLAPAATAQQMNGEMMGGSTMASPSTSASASTSATASAYRGHHGDVGSSASAAVGGRLPNTGGVRLASLGALNLLVGFGLVAARLLRRGT